ncbi:tRNA nucleotidyltransferase [Cutibacterium acnes JCM 18916]|nr:tRNA nucleotidyltransferase [Cutibacterium acnes JCM 18916]
MMRAARFTSQLGFTVTNEVRAAMTDMASRIEIISAERVRDELSKTLLTDHPREGLDLLVTTRIADYVLPELPALRLERDEHHRHKDVYEHSLTVLDQSIDLEKRRGHDPDLTGRLAALLHDIGKPSTRKFEPGGKVSFHHHDIVGAKMARKRLKALTYPSQVVKEVSKLVELHLRFHATVIKVGLTRRFVVMFETPATNWSASISSPDLTARLAIGAKPSGWNSPMTILRRASPI